MLLLQTPRRVGSSTTILSGSVELLLLVYTSFFLFSACYAVPTENPGVFRKDLKADPVFPDAVARPRDGAEGLEARWTSGVDLQINDAPDAQLTSISRLRKRETVKSSYQMPGVYECVKHMEFFEEMTSVNLNLPWIFYTGYPIEKEHAITWAAAYFKEKPNASKEDYKFIAWGRSFLNKWANSIQSSMVKGMKDSKPSFPPKVQLLFADRFLKNVARAYAREARGDIYLVVSDSTNPDNSPEGWNVDTAWGGWELPTLTANTAVNNIYRVDPSKKDAPRVIWKKGQASIGTPRGNMLSLSPAFDSETEQAVGLN